MERMKKPIARCALYRVRFEFFSLAARMIALAREFGHAAGIGTGGAAVFGSMREYTVTSRMRAFR
jgi:hypothetical protein